MPRQGAEPVRVAARRLPVRAVRAPEHHRSQDSDQGWATAAAEGNIGSPVRSTARSTCPAGNLHRAAAGTASPVWRMVRSHGVTSEAG